MIFFKNKTKQYLSVLVTSFPAYFLTREVFKNKFPDFPAKESKFP